MSDKKNSDELQVLRDDLAQLRADMQELVSTVGRIGEDAGNAVVGQASRLAGGVRDWRKTPTRSWCAKGSGMPRTAANTRAPWNARSRTT